MPWNDRLSLWLRPTFYLGTNRTTLAGVVLTSSSAFTMLGFWLVEWTSGREFHPYTGIIVFLILPGVFLAGLALIPIGAILRRRKLRRAGQVPDVYPRIDLTNPILLRGLALVGVMTFMNVSLLGVASYRGIQHMDSAQFCGQTCHVVMQPEYTAFVDSPHSRVGCVECHIGPGAPGFVRSKLSGVRQVFAVTFKTHSTPIPSPVKELRPARETCAHCHWPEKFHGDKLLVRRKFSSDEANTPLTTVLVLKIGGRTWQGLTGIHGRHLDTESTRITYISTDGKRQLIPSVTYRDDDGQAVEFTSTEVKLTPEELAKGEHRAMDCMDCHNRPSHTFQLPERAVDHAMADARISRTLPYIKKQAVEVLRADYPSREQATAKIAAALEEFYRSKYPEVYRSHRSQVQAAVQQVQNIYLRNVFPQMKVTWGTYPNNIGHDDFLGCFRCHDGSHSTSKGRTITQDCNACHTILAMEDSNPKILKDLGFEQ